MKKIHRHYGKVLIKLDRSYREGANLWNILYWIQENDGFYMFDIKIFDIILDYSWTFCGELNDLS